MRTLAAAETFWSAALSVEIAVPMLVTRTRGQAFHSDRMPEKGPSAGRNLYFAFAALTISATKSSTFHSLPINTFCTLPYASTTTVRKL